MATGWVADDRSSALSRNRWLMAAWPLALAALIAGLVAWGGWGLAFSSAVIGVGAMLGARWGKRHARQ